MRNPLLPQRNSPRIQEADPWFAILFEHAVDHALARGLARRTLKSYSHANGALKDIDLLLQIRKTDRPNV